MRHHDPARTGQSDSLGPTTGDIAWSYRIPEPPSGIAVAASGRIVLGPSFNDAWWSCDTFVSFLDPSAQLLFRKRVTPYPWGMSQGVYSGPAIAPGGGLIVPSSNGEVLKFSQTGNLIWTFSGSPGATNDSSPAVLPDGSIRHTQLLVGLVALRPDGSVIWQTSGTGNGAVAVNAAGEIALGTERSNEPHGFPALTYYGSDGTLRWTHSTSNGGGSTPVFGPDGTVYAAIDTDGIVAFNPDGTIKWRDLGFGGWSHAPALADGGTLHAVSGSTMRAYDAVTGAQRWTLSVGRSLNDGLVIDGAGKIYGTSGDGWVVCIAPGGSVAWQRRVADSLSPHPALDSSRRLIVSGRIGFESFVLAIR